MAEHRLGSVSARTIAGLWAVAALLGIVAAILAAVDGSWTYAVISLVFSLVVALASRHAWLNAHT
jgi:hypothetical protein